MELMFITTITKSLLSTEQILQPFKKAEPQSLSKFTNELAVRGHV